ncbi:MAG TPA: DUF6285 domain-containing protein [Polyangiaceae bacterium]|nr:DUF6285 domain-containing protein [Polyangiaceae bacterium]
MQDAPDRETILLGLAKFLEREIRPLVKDPRASFRVLVGAHLAFTAAMESMDEDADVAAELERLRALTGDSVPAPESLRDKKRRVAALEGRLCEAIRDPKTSAAELDTMRPALRASLLAKLRVNNPRFDTRADIE